MKLRNNFFAQIKKSPLNDFLKDSDNQELMKGAGITFSLKMIGVGFSYIFNIILARLYGAEVMGLFAISIAVAGIFSIFAMVGTETSTVRFVSEHASHGNYGEVKEIYQKMLHIVLPLSFVIAAILFFLSPYIANYIIQKPKLILPLKITAFVLPFGAFMGVNIAALRGLKKVKDAFIFSTILPPIFNFLGLVLLTYLLVKNYLTPFYVNLMTGMLGAFISLKLWNNWSKKMTIEKNIENKRRVSITEILQISLPMFMTSAMLFILGWTDILMLGVFRSAEEVGVYQIAMKIALFSSFSLAAMNSIAAPKISELFWRSKNDQLRKVVRNSSKVIFWSSLPILLIIVIFPNQILGVFGGEFLEGKIALIILTVGQFLNAYFGSIGVLLDMTGNQTIFRNSILVGAVSNIILNSLLIPSYGSTGAAIATAVSTIIWNLIASFAVLRKFKFWVGYLPELQIKKV